MMLMGSTRSRRYLARAEALGWGRLFAAEKPAPKPGEPWALDNGVFSAWKKNVAWQPERFLRSIDQSEGLHTPMFAVLPDIVGGGAESIRHSIAWLARLPSMPWFLAVQDGMSRDDVRAVLPDVAGLFLGGTDAFKATAPMWCELAHEHGKGFHYARISTANRLRAALECGADSGDSSQMLWSDENFDRFERWWRDLHAQVSLFGGLA